VLHRGAERLLILVSAGLYVIDELEVDPASDPVPIQIVYDDILLHDPAVVVSPGYEDGVRTAPSPKILKNLGEAAPKAEALLVKTGEFLDLVVHSAEVDGLDIGLKFLRRNISSFSLTAPIWMISPLRWMGSLLKMEDFELIA
jgi:hypothetical protein